MISPVCPSGQSHDSTVYCIRLENSSSPDPDPSDCVIICGQLTKFKLLISIISVGYKEIIMIIFRFIIIETADYYLTDANFPLNLKSVTSAKTLIRSPTLATLPSILLVLQ